MKSKRRGQRQSWLKYADTLARNQRLEAMISNLPEAEPPAGWQDRVWARIAHQSVLPSRK